MYQPAYFAWWRYSAYCFPGSLIARAKVPAGALFRRGGEWAVFRVEDGHVAARTVKIGHDNGLEAEVLGGLTEGDRIVLHPSDRVTDGVAVRER